MTTMTEKCDAHRPLTAAEMCRLISLVRPIRTGKRVRKGSASHQPFTAAEAARLLSIGAKS